MGNVEQMIRATLEVLRSEDQPPHACVHALAPRSGPSFVCAVHPAAGILCRDCAEEHFARHENPDGCDRCGADRETAPVQATTRLELVLRHPSGVERIGPADLCIGASLCRSCLS